MGGKRVEFPEFQKNLKRLREVPRLPGESEKEWLYRLHNEYGCRTRTWLQNVLKAMKEAGSDDDRKIWEAYSANRIKVTEEVRAKQEEQIRGQIQMELMPAEAPEMSDQTKMMRFQAAQVDKLLMKLDKLNDTMCMVLRAVRGD